MNKSEMIRQALARGYCTKRNENKILDSALIEDMAVEIEKAGLVRKPTVGEIKKFLIHYFEQHRVAIQYQRQVGENYQDFENNLAQAVIAKLEERR